MTRPRHSKKEVEAALVYAEANGWRVEPASGHAWGNMRKLLQSHLATFPLPLHEGRAALWHLAEVLEWFRTHQHKAVDEALREVARVSMQANVARETRRLPPEEIQRFEVLAS